jgi:hypothetical protein
MAVPDRASSDDCSAGPKQESSPGPSARSQVVRSRRLVVTPEAPPFRAKQHSSRGELAVGCCPNRASAALPDAAPLERPTRTARTCRLLTLWLAPTRYRSGRAMRSHHSLRASDADRDAAVDRLREAAGEGRLEPDELEQRVDGALRARTYGELAELLADLPADGRVPSPRARWRTDPLARSAVLGAGLLVAVIMAFAVVVVVAMLVLAGAASWIALVLFWLVCCGSRRRLVWGRAGRRSVTARHAHRVRPTGSL